MIDTSGKWWKGSDPADISEYLTGLLAQGTEHAVDELRPVRCRCGGGVFGVRFDQNEGFVERRCVGCESKVLMLDSADAARDARPKKWRCVCKSAECNLGVAFSMIDSETVRWVYVGCRCARCGVLGCFADWKIMHAPSASLLDAV